MQFLLDYIRAGEVDFEIEGPWNTEKYDRQEKYLNSRRSRMAKTATF